MQQRQQVEPEVDQQQTVEREVAPTEVAVELALVETPVEQRREKEPVRRKEKEKEEEEEELLDTDVSETSEGSHATTVKSGSSSVSHSLGDSGSTTEEEQGEEVDEVVEESQKLVRRPRTQRRVRTPSPTRKEVADFEDFATPPKDPVEAAMRGEFMVGQELSRPPSRALIPSPTLGGPTQWDMMVAAGCADDVQDSQQPPLPEDLPPATPPPPVASQAPPSSGRGGRRGGGESQGAREARVGTRHAGSREGGPQYFSKGRKGGR